MSDTPLPRVVLVTGPSGAGRSTAINVLEDLRYETIDNIPLRLISRLIEAESVGQPLALGIDVRNRDFSAAGLLDLYHQLRNAKNIAVTMLYLDCASDVLQRRYSETRRRHPLAPAESPTEGIRRELQILEPVLGQSDIVIDTSELSPHDLRAQLQGWFQLGTDQMLAVAVQSFSYKRGVPHGADMVLDCRFLKNPYWCPDLRAMTGLDASVSDYICSDTRFAPFVEHVLALVTFVLPAHVDEGKAHFSIGFGCTGGQHRSVAMTERIAAGLVQAGWRVSIRHQELERRGLAAAQRRVIGDDGVMRT
ncbi:MAG: RNase adapter RapZ [Rhodobacteraceae bacterium]|nr:RNase adapter RapZ [Paracoccaceae bacterium]